MKLLILFALVALAFAEPEPESKSDPYYYYSGYPRSYSYSSYFPGYRYGGYRYYKRSAESEPEAKADPYYYYSGYPGYSTFGSSYIPGYGTYNAAGYRYLYKREAESEPEADPKSQLINPYIYSSAYSSGISPYYNLGYTSGVYPYSAYRYVVKRDAESKAESKAESNPVWPYTTYAHAGYAHLNPYMYSGIAGYPYTTGLVYGR